MQNENLASWLTRLTGLHFVQTVMVTQSASQQVMQAKMYEILVSLTNSVVMAEIKSG